MFRYFTVFLKEESDTNTETEAAVSTRLRRPDSRTIQTRLSLNSPEHELRQTNIKVRPESKDKLGCAHDDNANMLTLV